MFRLATGPMVAACADRMKGMRAMKDKEIILTTKERICGEVLRMKVP